MEFRITDTLPKLLDSVMKCVSGLFSVQPILSSDVGTLGQQVPIEILRKLGSVAVVDRPHSTNNTSIACCKHPGGKVDGLITKFNISGTRLTRGEESELGVFQVQFHDASELESSVGKCEATCKRPLRVLSTMTS